MLDEEDLEMLMEREKDNNTVINKNGKNRHTMILSPMKFQFFNEPIIPPNEKDKRIVKDIDIIIDSIKETFKNHSNDAILDALKMNSFNITNTYFFLSNPQEFKDLCFTDVDDYIIKNMKSSSYYNEIVENKGKELVKERENFLMIYD